MKKIEWKPIPSMKPGDPHVHQAWMTPGPEHIRFAKGHYITRPYWNYSSSKWENSFPDVYEVLLQPLKHKSDVRLLEFGVYAGESIRYFRDFFTHPDAKIVGFDHSPCETFGAPYSGSTHNVTLWQGKQEEPKEVQAVCEAHGPFDVIIDDGSHSPELTEDVFRSAWEHLKDGGLYLIEDIGNPDISHLLDEIVITSQGKGFFSSGSRGFGPRAGQGGLLVLLKTQDCITGLEEDIGRIVP